MYRKMLSFVLLGIFLVGSLTVAYGTVFDKGFAASVASVAGADGDDKDEHRKGRTHDKDKQKHRDEDDED